MLENLRSFLNAATASQENNIRVSNKLSASRQRMALNALTLLRPTIITLLQKSWQASGLPQGPLYNAAILNPLIICTLRGIRITLQPGIPPIKNKSGKSTYSIYKQSAALQYGAVRGAHAKSASKAKKRLKQIGGDSVVAAHPFYNLSKGDIQTLQTAFNELMQEQINSNA